MTNKELSYLEDCLGAEQELQTKCLDYANRVQDTEIKQLLNELASCHQKHFGTLGGLKNEQDNDR